jgi:glutamate-5-semialdehyde dehydrogenase
MTPTADEACGYARDCSVALATSTAQARNRFVFCLVEELLKDGSEILRANRVDIAAAEKDGMPATMVRRLVFSQKHIESRIQALGKIAGLPDPLGVLEGYRQLPNGLWAGKMCVPIGVVAFVYDAWPYATLNAAALCLKAGNPCILKGSKETRCTNQALQRVMERALHTAGLPVRAVQLVSHVEQDWMHQFITDSRIDLIIPCGGLQLVKEISETARVPVLKHYRGVCQAYVHSTVNLAKAEAILLNAKCQAPDNSNALDNLFIDEAIAAEALPRLCGALKNRGVEIRGDEKTRTLFPEAKEATEQDFAAEYLDMILSVGVVTSYEDALDRMRKYTSGHTELILTEDQDLALRFLREMDGGVVLVNCSTLFNDGEELGLGAEIGISTDKLHARGPIGLSELTSRKWVVLGDGQVKTK